MTILSRDAAGLFPGFDARYVDVAGNRVFVRVGGVGPPLLLLHGFPETHLMWRDVAPRLATAFTVICADLRGYGASACPPSAPDHTPYSKRVMGDEMVAVMRSLGFDRFAVAGHDRGGRVACRMALDHPDTVIGLAVLDLVPTAAAWDLADDRFAIDFWPWGLLAQPAPLPETLLAGAARAVVEAVIRHWGSSPDHFPEAVVDVYVDMVASDDHAHAICEEYRAAAGIDREHDVDDLDRARSIACDTLVLWSDDGPLARWYDPLGGPLGVWQPWAPKAEGQAMAGGHFFPEAHPAELAATLAGFFMRGAG